jgi:hypothetical protein
MILDQKGERRIRIAIAVPCDDTINAGTAYDLASLAARDGYRDLNLMFDRGSILPAQRARLVERALEIEASHVLWFDRDMRFPVDTLERLLQHEKAIVAANYTTRRMPYLPTAEGENQRGYLFSGPMSTGLVPVAHVGMGCMLVDTDVFKKLKRPWFTLGFNLKENVYAGEDVYFCAQARRAGFEVLVDADLSKDVSHAGELQFTLQHANMTRDAVNAAQAAKGK